MKRILGAVLGAALIGATPVQAQQQLCDSSGSVCVLANFTLTNGGNTLQMYVFNGPTALSSATSSGLMAVMVGLPGSLAYAPSVGSFSSTFVDYNGTTQTSTNLGFTYGYTLSGDVLTIDLAAQGANPSPYIGTTAGPSGGGFQTVDRSGAAFGSTWDYALFTWNLNTAMTQEQLAQIVWGFRSQRIDSDFTDQTSIKCEVTGAGLWSSSTSCDLTTWDDPGGPNEVVPEPATMTLLATGLVGLAATRRRKKHAA